MRKQTKLQKILEEKKMTQRDFKRLLEEHEVFYDDSRISRMCTGLVTNYSVRTARTLSKVLNTSLENIVEKNP